MGRIRFYYHVVGCYIRRGGHDWKNSVSLTPIKQCRFCGGFAAVKPIYGDGS